MIQESFWTIEMHYKKLCFLIFLMCYVVFWIRTVIFKPFHIYIMRQMIISIKIKIGYAAYSVEVYVDYII